MLKLSPDQTIPESLFRVLPRDALVAMADAAVTAVACIEELSQADTNLVLEVLKGSADFVELDHYPADDIYDPDTHAQFYFHAHRDDEDGVAECGHFHTFLRPKGMPAGIRPAPVPDYVTPAGDNDDLSHIIAISMSPEGMPVQLFTTNRWVTGDIWYAAPDVIAMIDRFAIDVSEPSPALSRWITAMMKLFKPQIAQLLLARDREVESWRRRHPDANVLEDRGLEITSAMDISLYHQIEALDRVLDEDATQGDKPRSHRRRRGLRPATPPRELQREP